MPQLGIEIWRKVLFGGFYRYSFNNRVVDVKEASIGLNRPTRKWLNSFVFFDGCIRDSLSKAPGTNLFWQEPLSEFAITADACLDNRQELACFLDIPLNTLSEFSDAFLILKAYYCWGVATPKYLLGDYAFAIWDPNNQLLFFARDPVGVKPFYFSLTGEKMVFSSTIKDILTIPNVSQQINEPYLATALHYRWYFHLQQTFYQSVQRLLPGHFMVVKRDHVHTEKYWHPDSVPDVHCSSDKGYIEKFQGILGQVVRDYLRTDLTVGTHLSGGLDSSSITVLAARELKRQCKEPPQVYCWQSALQSDKKSGFEHNYIESVCRQESLKPKYLSYSPSDIVSVLQRDMTQETIDGGLFRESVVQRTASTAGVRILLSGWGGDQFASHNGATYYAFLLSQGRLFKVWQDKMNNPFHSFFGRALKPLLSSEARKIFPTLNPGEFIPAATQYIHPDLADRVNLLPNPKASCGISIREQQLRHLSTTYITHRLEAWAVSAAQYGIIYRYPLLDKRVLEFVLGLPPDQFRHGKIGRLLIRNAMKGILPEDVRMNQRKDEPHAVSILREACGGALTQVGQTLASRDELPSRAMYIDMPRLVDDLTINFNPKNPRFGRVASALLFLDW